MNPIGGTTVQGNRLEACHWRLGRGAAGAPKRAEKMMYDWYIQVHVVIGKRGIN